MFKCRVKFVESFKDGNILDGRQFLADEVEVMSESDFLKIQNSGGVVVMLEKVIPNPKKQEAEEPVEAQPASGAKAKSHAK